MPKRIILMLAGIWILITFMVIQTTYAKYVTILPAEANVSISSWNLILNNQNITNESNFSENLNLIFPATQYHSADAMVPGATGYFDLTVDASDVNLSFKYTVTCTIPSTNEIIDLKVVAFAVDGHSVDLHSDRTAFVDDTTTPMVNYVQASANSSTLRVYVMWDDEAATSSLNDVEDTYMSLNSRKAKITANVKFEQTL